MVLLLVLNVKVPVLNVLLKLLVLNVLMVTRVPPVINVLITVRNVLPKINVMLLNVNQPLFIWLPLKLVLLQSLVNLMNTTMLTSVKPVEKTV